MHTQVIVHFPESDSRSYYKSIDDVPKEELPFVKEVLTSLNLRVSSHFAFVADSLTTSEYYSRDLEHTSEIHKEKLMDHIYDDVKEGLHGIYRDIADLPYTSTVLERRIILSKIETLWEKFNDS